MYKVNVSAFNTVWCQEMRLAGQTEMTQFTALVFHNDREFRKQARAFLQNLARTGYSKIDTGMLYFEAIYIQEPEGK